MALHLYNTLKRQAQPFEPIQPRQVNIYCCGVTVYDYCHIGHGRSYINWDTLRRYLQWRGYQVRYVQNFTDIDDKILNRAKEQGETMEAVSGRFIDAYFEDLRRLNVRDADEYPRATEHIEQIYTLIEALQLKNFAYAVQGNVYYRVRQLEGYGELSGRQLDQMQAGAGGRVDAEDPSGQCKQDPFDFALWKAAKPTEPFWQSPWGQGRPGWHIECSAMIKASFGDTIDIHTGGADLIFPHHENEIAQSRAATGKPLANYWLHNGMVRVDGEKMSKSLGNFITIRQLLDGDWNQYPQPVDPMTVRLFVLQANYRKPLDFTAEAIASAQNGWNTLRSAITEGQKYLARQGVAVPELDLAPQAGLTEGLLTSAVEGFNALMDDDLNTSGGLAVLFDLAKTLQRELNLASHQGKPEMTDGAIAAHLLTLITLADVLGLQVEAGYCPAGLDDGGLGEAGLDEAAIEALIQQRLDARKSKNFAEADRIRNDLQAQGITLIDTPTETRWKRE
jgi:cysteinyl-tRNA synthetase